MDEAEEFDYIIVGGGSAGGVLASRLTEDGRDRVLLVEAGSGRRSLTKDVPALLFLNFERGAYNWRFDSSAQDHLGGRTVYHPRGKGLGGSSSINAMVYMRGHPQDFDGWALSGARGWDYASVLPYFKRCESFQDGGDPAYRGRSGPVKTARSRIWAGRIQNPFMEAGAELGFPVTDDVNGFRQEGFSMFDMNIGDGRRNGTEAAYIRPALQRTNLEVSTRSRCDRVVLEGARATGVELSSGGRTWTARARKEVILCAGAAKSPQILMLSGIGPGAHLRAHGLPVYVDLKGVGQNLQDHSELHLKYEVTEPVAYNRYLRPDRALVAGLKWLLGRDSVAGTNAYECGAFFRSAENVPFPDQLIHFNPVHLNGWKPAIGRHGFALGLNDMRCRSIGEVRLSSPDPRAAPVIDPNYLSDPEDLDRMVRFLDLGRAIVAARAFDGIRGREVAPGAHVQSRADKEAFVRENLASSYHLSCTCRMGDDDLAVTDPQGRVRGCERLRVVDASLMPMVTNGNLNAPVMMMAERISDLIRGRPLLAAEEVPVAPPVAGAANGF